jgi:hypothetical protein
MPALSESLNFVVGNQNNVSVTYPNSGTSTLVYFSDKTKGDGYFSSSDGIHTVMYTATPTFVGTVTTQATLASEPTSSDWFDVSNTTVSYRVLDDRSTSTVDYFKFAGNFVWIRGKIQIDSGTVQSILINH